MLEKKSCSLHNVLGKLWTCFSCCFTGLPLRQTSVGSFCWQMCTFFPSFFRSIAVNQFNIHDQFYIHFDFNDHQIWIGLFIVVFSRMDTKLTVLIVAWKRHIIKFLSSRRTVTTNQMFKTSLEVFRGMSLFFILPSIFEIWCANHTYFFLFEWFLSFFT